MARTNLLARNKVFLVLLSGQWVSAIGDSLFVLAAYWYALSITHNPLSLGWVGAALSLPGLVGLLSGVYVDRCNKRFVMICVDVIRAAILLSLSAVLWYGTASLPLLIVIIVVLESAGTFFSPAYRATIPAVIESSDLISANGLSSAAMSVSGLIGQMLGGTLMLLFGPAIIFLLDGVSFLASVFSIGLVRWPVEDTVNHESHRDPSFLSEWLQGIKSMWGLVFVRIMVLAAMALNGVSQVFSVLLAEWVRGPLHSNALGFGMLGMALGIGALVGSVVASWVMKRLALPRATLVSFWAFGLIVMAIALVPNLWVTAGLCLVEGVLEGVIGVGAMTYLQMHVPRELQGRVFGAIGGLAVMVMPVGAAVGGIVASVWPLPFIYVGVGIAAILAAAPLLSLWRDPQAAGVSAAPGS